MPLDMDRFSVGDAPELTLRLLSHFVEGEPPEAARHELQRFLWNTANYGWAVPLSSALGVLKEGRAGNFVYHQRSQLMFTGVGMSGHQLLMAHLATLHRTDWTNRSMDDWGPDCIHSWNANSRLADDFIESGFGFFRSSQHAPDVIMVAREFAWTAQEKRVFASFTRRHP